MRKRRLVGALLATVVGVAMAPGIAHAAGGPNLAPGKAATVSGANGPYGASNVNDGDASSYGESPNSAFPQWVQIDLGSGTSIDEVKLRLPPATAWPARRSGRRGAGPGLGPPSRPWNMRRKPAGTRAPW